MTRLYVGKEYFKQEEQTLPILQHFLSYTGANRS